MVGYVSQKTEIPRIEVELGVIYVTAEAGKNSVE